MRAEILSTHTPALFHQAADRATELLRTGAVVALPTETVYGLAANALNAEAVERIFKIKGRPATNPIIVHVVGEKMVRRCVAEWPPLAEKLARAFWPGPLTMVLPRSKEIPAIVTAGGCTVGVRWPSHPLIQEVIELCDFPLAAPSANPSNQLSPTNAQHVQKHLGDKIPLIVDGGQCQVGLESTVLDLTVSPPRLLRAGMIHETALLAVVGELNVGKDSEHTVLKSPGLLEKHYSPKARLMVLEWSDDADLKAQVARMPQAAAGTHVISHTRIPSGDGFGRVSVIPHDAAAFARAIYAELHACDEAGAELIIVEALPCTDEWRAIADRLRRGSAT